uniref:Sushi domain-containing protein n=1 Tax=Strigops habroptila TaxID=2489341 RepID=A0A672V5D1_STRHB
CAGGLSLLFPRHCLSHTLSWAFCLPVAVQPCRKPPEIPNGNHSGRGKAFFTMGMSVIYTCDPGYYLVGNNIVFCKASGNWSQPSPRCEAAVCVNPHIRNGRRVDGQGLLSAPGQAVTFQCHDGYSLQGNDKVICQEDGSWHPPLPICDRLYHDQGLSNKPEIPGKSCHRERYKVSLPFFLLFIHSQ